MEITKMNRREFLIASGAAFLMAGCKVQELFGSPEISFGVVSDIHITTKKSCRLFKRSLKYFKRRGVDAVMIPGDLTDWGIKENLVYFKTTWDSVFGGTEVKPLFCTGNHDFDGWWYGDMTMEMHANGYSEETRMYRYKKFETIAENWREILGEELAPVRMRTVKGYDFVCSEYYGSEKLGEFMEKNAERLSGKRPFFYFQHEPVKGTTGDSGSEADKAGTKAILSKFPNCISFSGHTHQPFISELSIWQGGFTQIAVPSLSYATLPYKYENGYWSRNGRATATMPMVPNRFNLRGGQGYLVKVWPEQVVVERIDLEEEEIDLPAWVIPLNAKEKPFAQGVREKFAKVPQFPQNAGLEIETRNTENRKGEWAIVMYCEFASAKMPAEGRVFDYVIRVIDEQGVVALEKKFVSPAWAKMAKFEPARQQFWFNVAELPQERDCHLEIVARNCFGGESKPLVSEVIHMKPGLGKADKTL